MTRIPPVTHAKIPPETSVCIWGLHRNSLYDYSMNSFKIFRNAIVSTVEMPLRVSNGISQGIFSRYSFKSPSGDFYGDSSSQFSKILPEIYQRIYLAIFCRGFCKIKRTFPKLLYHSQYHIKWKSLPFAVYFHVVWSFLTIFNIIFHWIFEVNIPPTSLQN